MACLQNCFLRKKDWNATGANRKWDKAEKGFGALQSVQLILQRTFPCLGVNFSPAIDSIGKHVFEKSHEVGVTRLRVRLGYLFALLWRLRNYRNYVQNCYLRL
jgi:hypothetical protein